MTENASIWVFNWIDGLTCQFVWATVDVVSALSWYVMMSHPARYGTHANPGPCTEDEGLLLFLQPKTN